MGRLLYLLWLATVIAFIGQVIYFYPGLPDVIAVHFNMAGEPDRWIEKWRFILEWGGISGLLNLFFLVLMLFISKVPAKLISAPNKDYWFANNERKTCFYARVRQVTSFCISGINAILIIVFDSVVKFARTSEFTFPMTAFVAILAVVMLGGIGAPVFLFRKTEESK
ncbi:MAG: DUF1648 domain-containing protein [Planctomycetes bacterium]|nr:DUF1648 domain-containing protein [Planctomycetota bacterium]